MYNNIGAKIKILAQFSAWAGIFGSVIYGFVLISKGSDGVWVGIITLVVGSICSWISSWLLYGFGELIENTTEIAKNTKNTSSSAGKCETKETTCKCGTKNEDDMDFCQNCGNPL